MLSNGCMDKLRIWLKANTWHTNDLGDMNRWYDFVDRYQRDHGHRLDETAVLRSIEEELGGLESEYLQSAARERISLAVNILEFLERTRT